MATRLGGLDVVLFAAGEGWSWYLMFVPIGVAIVFYREIFAWFLSELEREDAAMERERLGRWFRPTGEPASNRRP